MKALEYALLFLIFIFSFICFISLKGINFDSLYLNRYFMDKLYKRNKFISYKEIQMNVYFENFKNIKVFFIKIDSMEHLFLIKIYSSFLSFFAVNFFGILFKTNFLVASIILAAVSYLLPTEIIRGRIIKLKNKIYLELSDFIDLLSSLISAGLTLNESINYIIENYKGEIRRLLKIMKIKRMEGFSEKESFEFIAKISFCDEFRNLTTVLIQSEKIGYPIKDVLRDISKDIRNSMKDNLKIKAEKLESNLIVIIFIFIFVPMLLIFIAPVIPQINLFLN